MSQRTAIYPGSFDPITNGHVDIINRSANIFKKLIVAILKNPQKEPMFSTADRMDLIKDALGPADNIEIVSFDGLLVNFATEMGATVIVRGLREISDFEYEFQMALMNRRLNDSIETVFMMPKEEYSYLSSRLVKEIGSLGGDIRGLVPENVRQKLKRVLKSGDTRR